jgi:hypothetical protein
MADSDVRLRVETLRHAWIAERQGRVERAIERLDKIIDMAMELQRPTAALKAMDLQLKLTGVIRDTRAGLYADSPDDDLSKVFFDPREDEDPDFNPDSYPAPTEAEVSIPEPDEPAEPEDDHTTAPAAITSAAITSAAVPPASGADGKVQMMTFAARSPQSPPLRSQRPPPRYCPVTPAG